MESKYVCLCVLVVLVGFTQAIKWQDCGSKKGKVKSMSVSGCDQSDICNLPKGKNVSFAVDFTSNEAATNATAVVHGILGGVPMPFPFSHPDACTDSGLKCPLKAGTAYNYKANIFVDPSYPKLKVIVKWEVKDQNSDDLFCVEVPVAIVDSQKENTVLRYQPKAKSLLLQTLLKHP